MLRIDDIPQQVADDIQGYALIVEVRLFLNLVRRAFIALAT